MNLHFTDIKSRSGYERSRKSTAWAKIPSSHRGWPSTMQSWRVRNMLLYRDAPIPLPSRKVYTKANFTDGKGRSCMDETSISQQRKSFDTRAWYQPCQGITKGKKFSCRVLFYTQGMAERQQTNHFWRPSFDSMANAISCHKSLTNMWTLFEN